MSFRKRNVIIGGAGAPSTRPGAPAQPGAAAAVPATPPAAPRPPPQPGVRPSPINGQPTTSTGTPSLDALLAGHSGLLLGHSILIEEPGTTDYGGALLRYYASEGIVQGHQLTVVGVPESWVRTLPGVIGSADKPLDEDRKRKESDRMKIAWRYERLGDYGSGIGGSRAQAYTPQRTPTQGDAAPQPFCHQFDLTKPLALPPNTKINFIPPPHPTSPPTSNPFTAMLQRITALITAPNPTNTPHRILIPSLLSPALYPPHASTPTYLLPFLHALRQLLRQHAKTLTLMISLPTTLYPRDTGVIRWAEMLCDGVIELVGLPRAVAEKGGKMDEPQGLVRVWKVPAVTERGGGVGKAAEGDLAFVVTRRRFEIMAYSLPPADGEEEEGHEGHGHGPGEHGHRKGAVGAEGKKTKVDLEF